MRKWDIEKHASNWEADFDERWEKICWTKGHQKTPVMTGMRELNTLEKRKWKKKHKVEGEKFEYEKLMLVKFCIFWIDSPYR